MRVLAVLLVAVLAAVVAAQTRTPRNVTLQEDDTIVIAYPSAMGGGARTLLGGAVASALRSSFHSLSLEMNISFTMWLENVNKKGIFLVDKPYQVEMLVLELGSSNSTLERSNIRNAVADMCAGVHGRIDFIFAAYSSSYAPVVAEQAEKCGILSISGHASDEAIYRCTPNAQGQLPSNCLQEGARRWQWAVSVQPKASNYLPEYINLARLKGAKTISLFYENVNFPQAIASGVRTTAADNNMPILLDIEVTRQTTALGAPGTASENTTLPKEQQDELESLVQQLIEKDADALAGGTYYDLCRNLMIKFREKNYLPKAIGMTTCMSQELIDDVRDYVTYVIGASGWDRRLRGAEYTETPDNEIFHWTVRPSSEGGVAQATTCEQFYDAFISHPLTKAAGITEPSYQAVGAYVEGYAIHETLRRAQSFNPLDWRTAMHALQINTVYGQLTLDNSGINYAKRFIALQVDPDGQQQIVAPASSFTLDAVYPMPTWDERKSDNSPYKDPSELGVVIATAVLIVATIGLMVLLFLWREKAQILAASILFCEIILAGGVLAYLTLFFWSIWVTDWTCIAQPWLLLVGIDLLLGALLIKNWRIQRIFKAATKALKKTVIPNMVLIRAIGVVTVVDIVLLVIWHAAFTPYAKLVQPDPYRPSLDYYQCASSVPEGLKGIATSKTIEEGFIWVLGAYKFAQMFAGVVMAFMLRNTPSAFNEAKYIGYALYNMFFCLVLLLVIWRVIPPSELVLNFVLRSVIVLWGITMSIVAIFGPKVYFVLTDDKNPNGNPQMTRRTMNNSFAADGSSSSSSSGAAQVRAELERVKEQLRKAQAENEMLRSTTAAPSAGNAAEKVAEPASVEDSYSSESSPSSASSTTSSSVESASVTS